MGLDEKALSKLGKKQLLSLIRELREENESLKDDKEAYRSAQEERFELIHALRMDNAQLQADVHLCHDKIQRLEEKLKKKETDDIVIDSSINISDNVGGVKKRLLSQQELINGETVETSSLKEQIQKMKADYNELHAKALKVQAKGKQCKDLLNEKIKQLNERTAQLNESKKKLIALEKIEIKANEYKEGLDKTKKQLETSQSDIKNKDIQINSLTDTIQKKDKEIEKCKQTQKELEDKIKSLEENNSKTVIVEEIHVQDLPTDDADLLGANLKLLEMKNKMLEQKVSKLTQILEDNKSSTEQQKEKAL